MDRLDQTILEGAVSLARDEHEANLLALGMLEKYGAVLKRALPAMAHCADGGCPSCARVLEEIEAEFPA